MSIYPNITEQDLIKLRKLAEQQTNQRAQKIKHRNLKQTHDVKLAESLSPLTKKVDQVNKSTQEIAEIVKETNTPQLVLENTTGAQSLRDALAFMRQSRNFSKLEERPDGKMFWNDVRIKPVGENRTNTLGKEYDITPSIQYCFTKTSSTTKSLNNNEKETVYNILKDVGFYNMKHTIGLKSARMRDALIDLPKVMDKIRNPPSPAIENVEDSSDLEGQGSTKNIIPSKIIDTKTRLELLLGINLSGHTDTLTEHSNLKDHLHKRGEIQNKQQYRNALDKFSNIKTLTNINVKIRLVTQS